MKESQPVEIVCYGAVGSGGEIDPAKLIPRINEAGENPVVLRIHSGGGSALGGLALYEYLRSKKNVTAKIDGLCASAATLVALGCRKVSQAANGFMMVHSPWSMVAANSRGLEHEAEVLNKIEEQMIGIYATKTRKPRDQVKKWLEDETWFNCKEARAAGLIDEESQPMEFSACLTSFKKPPQALAQYISRVTPAGKVLTFQPGAMQKALTECSQGRVGRWEEIRFAGDSRISLLIESGVHGLLDQIRRSGKQPPKIPDCNSIRNAVGARRALEQFCQDNGIR